jgi:hypothetical protein
MIEDLTKKGKFEVKVEIREGYVLVTASGEFEAEAGVDAFPK